MQPMINIALRAARKAGDIIARASERLDLLSIEEKGANDYVTEIDKAAETEIVYHLHKAFPEHRIIGEEGGLLEGKDPESRYTWVIDPLDGTTNFIRGLPHFAVSIACKHDNRVEHAVIYDPIRHEEFIASRGDGARLNGKRIRVSHCPNLQGSLIGTGIPFRAHQQQHLDNYLHCLKELAEQSAGIRRAGSAALDLAYVAAGRLDAFWEIGLQEWDIAAGALLVQESGGLISDFKGGNDYLKSGNVVCGNPKCFKPVLQHVQQHLGKIG